MLGKGSNMSQSTQSAADLQQKYGINYRPPEWDKLLIACQKNNAQMVAKFVTPVELGGEGISPNHANAIDQSALHVACVWANVDCVSILLQHNANVHSRNKISAATPLHAACQFNRAVGTERRVQVVDLLLKAGADMNAEDQNGKRPVDYVQDSEKDSVQLRAMLTSTANLPATSFYYQIPQIEHLLIENVKQRGPIETFRSHLVELQSALQLRVNQEPEIKVLPDKHSPLKELLERWLECEDVDDYSLPALEAMLKYKYTFGDTTCNLYMEPNGPVDELVGQLCMAIVDRYKMIGKNFQDSLLQQWIDAVTLLRPFVTDTLACSRHWLEMSRRNYLDLAKVWWDVWRLDPTPIVGPQEMTPIHFAARSGNLEFVKLLVKIQTVESDNPKAIGYILAQKSKLGQTPLEAAKVNGKDDIVQWLESVPST